MTVDQPLREAEPGVPPWGAAELRGLALRLGLPVPGDDEDGVGYVVQQQPGLIVAANAAAQRVLGLTLDQMLGRTSQDPRWRSVDADGAVMPGEAHPAMRALATGEAVRGVLMGVHRPTQDAPGEHVWLEVSSVALDEQRRAVLTAFTPVTGARADELRLRDSERMFRLIAESSSDVVTLQLPDSTLLWASPASVRVLGRTPESLVGTRAWDLVHPDDLERVRAARRTAVAGRDSFTPAVRLRRGDGAWVWVESTTRAITEGGQVVQLQISSRDVSDRVAAERARAEAEGARDRAAGMFRTAMEHAPVGMALRPVDGTITEVNRALCEMLGRSADELVGGSLADLTHPDDLAGADDARAEMLAGRIAVHESERRYLRGDGSILWGQRTTVLLRDDTGAPSHFLSQVQDVTARKLAADQLARMAVTDPLTGLPNRVVLMDRLTHALAQARRTATQVGVLFVDLDHFKTVNDTLGHDVGDELLRQSALRLADIVREGDTTVRLGGDEFVVLCEQVTSLAQVREMAERICAAFDVPFVIDSHRVDLSASVGVTLGDGPSARDLLRQADTSMYGAKRRGRGQVDVYGQAAETSALDQLTLAEELRRGTEDGELRLLYQPVVEIASGRLVAREALVRWEHPVRGMLAPAEFLATAEQSRLVVSVGEWVLRHACADAASWADGTSVHVNISARHVAHVGFPELVAEVLLETGLPAARLVLEITETLVLNASPSVLASTRSLTALGVRLALDDFGTGQSSITALHRLPISALKIDRSFVANLPEDPASAGLVRGLIALGASMGLDVVAEGVETEPQQEWLRAQGCPHAQGYLYGRPTVTP